MKEGCQARFYSYQAPVGSTGNPLNEPRIEEVTNIKVSSQFASIKRATCSNLGQSDWWVLTVLSFSPLYATPVTPTLPRSAHEHRRCTQDTPNTTLDFDFWIDFWSRFGHTKSEIHENADVEKTTKTIFEKNSFFSFSQSKNEQNRVRIHREIAETKK